jgi:hypothetical protein
VKKIEIYATGDDGVRARLNEFRGDNAALQAMGTAHARYPGERDKLLGVALRAQAAWRSVLPHDKIEVIS